MISGSRIWRERENFLFDARQWRTAGTADWSLRNSQISHGRTRRFGRIRFGLNFFEHILRAPRRRVYVKFFYEFSLCIHTNLLGHNFYFWVFLNKLNKKADLNFFLMRILDSPRSDVIFHYEQSLAKFHLKGKCNWRVGMFLNRTTSVPKSVG